MPDEDRLYELMPRFLNSCMFIRVLLAIREFLVRDVIL
jgi:hypothetical protein